MAKGNRIIPRASQSTSFGLSANCSPDAGAQLPLGWCNRSIVPVHTLTLPFPDVAAGARRDQHASLCIDCADGDR